MTTDFTDNKKVKADILDRFVGSSQMKRELTHLLYAADSYAIKENKENEDLFYYSECYHSKVESIVNSLQRAFADISEIDWWDKFDESERKKILESIAWHHIDNPISYFMNNGKGSLSPNANGVIDRSAIEEATYDYAALPFEDRRFSKLLIDILIAIEISAFMAQMFDRKESLILKRPILKLKTLHPLSNFFINVTLNVLVFGGGAAALGYALHEFDVNGEYIVWPVGALIAWLALVLFLSVLYLPFQWIGYQKAKRKVLKILSKMNSVYSELKADGEISIKHIYARLEHASDHGVIWPASLFILLDDLLVKRSHIAK